VVVEVFSGFPHFIAVKDMTSLTTAKALVHHVLPFWGTEITLVSDKGPAFTSQVFKHISELLGIKHISSGARNPRSNGLAEAYVRRFAEYIKYYATDDYSIEDTIPLIEISICATPMSKLQLSPYQIVYGRKFPLAAPGQPAGTVTPDIQPTDCVSYFTWLSTELSRIHVAVKSVREEMKIEDKEHYDRLNRTVDPQWAVGDYVLLRDDSYKPGSSKVITRHRFTGPFVVQKIVKGKQDIGCAYQLIDEQTAKPVKYLVTHDRMKKYDVNREDFNMRLPRINTGEDAAVSEVKVEKQKVKSDDRPVEIVRIYRIKGKKHYKVRFADNKIYDCDWVNKPLLDHYNRKMNAKNARTRQNAGRD